MKRSAFLLRTVAAFVTMGSAALPARAANWPQWRGPALGGSSPEKGLPVKFSKTENVLWATPLPGSGESTPIIWDDHIFLTAIEDDSEKTWVVCLDRADGHVRWKHRIGAGFIGRTGNSAASPSAVTDGKRVIFLFGVGELLAYDFAGKPLWKRNIEKDHGRFEIWWGYGASPLLYRDKLYVAVIHRHTKGRAEAGRPKPTSYLLCIDPATGKDLWKRERTTDATGEAMEAYTTPYPFEGKGGPHIILAGADFVTAHSPADGKEAWRSADFNPRKQRAYRLVPTPVAVGDTLVTCVPRGSGMFAIPAGKSGQLTEADQAWFVRPNAPDVCTPLVMDGKLFVLDGRNRALSCLDPKTGKTQWQGKLPVDGKIEASPTGADGKIYCISLRGEVVVLSAGDTFEVLSQTRMGKADCRSTIAVAHGQLFIRTAEHLYCIANKTPAK